MADDAAIDDLGQALVRLPPQLQVYLRSRLVQSGRSLQGEIIHLIGEAMEAAAVPPALAHTPFVCSEELMAQKAECEHCQETIRHNAKLWAERHVQQTGHSVHVTLHFDLRDAAWRDRISPERRAEIEAIRQPGVAQAMVASLLTQKKH